MSIEEGQHILASHIWGEGTEFPATAVDGQTFYRTDQDQVYKYYDGAWHRLGEARVGTTASTATLTINSDTTDLAIVTAQAQALTIGAPTGTPTEGQKLALRLKDNGTSRALTWNVIFRDMDEELPDDTEEGKTMYFLFFYNSADSKWDYMASRLES